MVSMTDFWNDLHNTEKLTVDFSEKVFFYNPEMISSMEIPHKDSLKDLEDKIYYEYFYGENDDFENDSEKFLTEHDPVDFFEDESVEPLEGLSLLENIMNQSLKEIFEEERKASSH